MPPRKLTDAEMQERDALIRKRLLEGLSRVTLTKRMGISWAIIDRVYQTLVAKPTRKDTMKQLIDKLRMATSEIKGGMETHVVEDLKTRFNDIIKAIERLSDVQEVVIPAKKEGK